MAMTTCEVQAQVWDSHKGVPVEGAIITATLNAYELHEGVIAPHKVQVKTDASGYAVLELFPNELGQRGTYYDISIQSRLKGSLKAIAVVPNQVSVKLDEILNVDPFPAVAAPPAAVNAVSYAVAQSLTEEQQERARQNIGIDGELEVSAVSYDVEQNLTDEQQERARQNIGILDGIPGDNGAIEAALEELENVKATTLAENQGAVAQVMAIAISLQQGA